MLLVGRFLTGMGAGMANCSIPLYQSEVAPPSQRGRMVGLHGTALAGGYALAGWSGYGCYFETNPNIQWRLLLCLQVISPALLLAMTPWLPESPLWSILNDKMDEALQNLRKLHHTKEDPNDIMAREEFVQIQRQIALERSRPSTLWAMMKVPSYRRRLLIGFFIQFLAQSSGITVINNYSVLLYTQLGLSGSKTLLVYAFWVTLSCIANYGSSLIVDRFGRVRLFKVGVVSCPPFPAPVSLYPTLKVR
jgi:MFS family permease